MTADRQRLDYIDVLKGIGIIFVVLGHMFGIPYVNKIIASFHMPLFYFVSGFLHKSSSDTKGNVMRRVKGLLLPYGLYVLYNSVITGIAFLTDKLHLNFLTQIVNKLTFGGLWFIITLFFVTVLFFVIEKYVKSFRKMTVVVAFIYIAGLIMSLSGKANSDAVNVCMGLVFYFTGYLFKNKGNKIVKPDNKWLCLGIGVVLCIITCVNAVIFPTINMSLNQYGNPIMFYVTAMTGTFSCYFIAIFLEKIKLLQFYGKNSLVVLLTHFMVYKLVYMAFPKEHFPIYTYPVYIVVVFSLCALMVIIVNKYFRALTGDFKFLKD